MTSDDTDLGLLSDSSLEDPEQDQLGYADFAENMADTIETRIPRQDFVVGIVWAVGVWEKYDSEFRRVLS